MQRPCPGGSVLLVALLASAVLLTAPTQADYTKLYRFHNDTGMPMGGVRAVNNALEVIESHCVVPQAWRNPPSSPEIGTLLLSGTYCTKLRWTGDAALPGDVVKVGWTTADSDCRLRDLRWIGTDGVLGDPVLGANQTQGVPGGGRVTYDAEAGGYIWTITNDTDLPINLSDCELSVLAERPTLEELMQALWPGDLLMSQQAGLPHPDLLAMRVDTIINEHLVPLRAAVQAERGQPHLPVYDADALIGALTSAVSELEQSKSAYDPEEPAPAAQHWDNAVGWMDTFRALLEQYSVGTPWRDVALSDFDVADDLDGWHKTTFGGLLPPGNGTLAWQGVSGDGRMRFTDPSGGYMDYIGAPSKFLGDWIAKGIQRIAFDYVSDDTERTEDLDLVLIKGEGMDVTIWYYELPVPADTSWHTFAATFPSGWKWYHLAGRYRPLDEVLADVHYFAIEAEVHGWNAETSNFDNIRIQTTPLPQSLAEVWLDAAGAAVTAIGELPGPPAQPAEELPPPPTPPPPPPPPAGEPPYAYVPWDQMQQQTEPTLPPDSYSAFVIPDEDGTPDETPMLITRYPLVEMAGLIRTTQAGGPYAIESVELYMPPEMPPGVPPPPPPPADATPPAFGAASIRPQTLWPPNHKMVEMDFDVALADDSPGASWYIESVSSNQAVNGQGDGDTEPDWLLDPENDPQALKLRAERSGKSKDPRVYTVLLRAIDAAGNLSAPLSLEVRVEHDRGKHTGAEITSLSAVPTKGGRVQIVVTLSSAAQVEADVLNIAGRRIKSVVTNRQCESGTTSLLWSCHSDRGLAVPSGTYLIRVTARSPKGQQASRLCTVSVRR